VLGSEQIETGGAWKLLYKLLYTVQDKNEDFTMPVQLKTLISKERYRELQEQERAAEMDRKLQVGGLVIVISLLTQPFALEPIHRPVTSDYRAVGICRADTSRLRRVAAGEGQEEEEGGRRAPGLRDAEQAQAAIRHGRRADGEGGTAVEPARTQRWGNATTARRGEQHAAQGAASLDEQGAASINEQPDDDVDEQLQAPCIAAIRIACLVHVYAKVCAAVCLAQSNKCLRKALLGMSRWGAPIAGKAEGTKWDPWYLLLNGGLVGKPGLSKLSACLPTSCMPPSLSPTWASCHP
jgi:hypothetical protein